MALTIANECRKAALDGLTALLSGGSLLLTTAADAELAVLPIASVGAATTASPSVAVLTMTTDTSVTAGTITKFLLRTSGTATRINGTVGTSGADLIVTSNVVPSGATQVSCTGGISLSLQLS
jgi:hypothetical protein